ncbi:MAG: hypothetical protein HOP29_01750 [Phycisphaerales bacterium]|nr:hypothetical protein [Phycisphaerales bacterium]
MWKRKRIRLGACVGVVAATCCCCGCQPRSGGTGPSLLGARGEPWTIECLAIPGSANHDDAEQIADVLRRTVGIDAKAVFVRHTNDASTIYYGNYARRIDRLRGEREIPDVLKRDIGAIKDLGDERGRPLFLAARMVPLPTPDPGKPEWNLETANGTYSLQVAAFFATPEVTDYKKAAVDYVMELRKRNYEAFYHHGEANSVVTVGVFGAEAVIDRGGAVDYSDEVRALQRKESFAYNVTNGAIWKPKVGGQQAVVRSLLVRIPKPDRGL